MALIRYLLFWQKLFHHYLFQTNQPANQDKDMKKRPSDYGWSQNSGKECRNILLAYEKNKLLMSNNNTFIVSSWRSSRKVEERKCSNNTKLLLDNSRWKHNQEAYTANVHRQTTDKLMFKSVISTVRWIRK